MRAKNLVLGAVFLFVVGGAPALASADTVSILPDADNTMYSEDGALSNGAGDHVFAGTTDSGTLRRGLMSFDIAGAIPPGSTVTAVTLSLYLSRTRARAENISLHRVQQAWGEGTSHAAGEEGGGAAATTGDATWTHRMWSGTPWSTNGGVFSGTSSATLSVDRSTGYYAWSSAGMVTDVQGWLDSPSSNDGWIIVGNEVDLKSAKRFDSRQSADLATRPYLEITFDPPVGTTTGACCASDGGCTVVEDPGTTCTGTYQGADTMCSPNPCPQPEGACCHPDASATCTIGTETECTTAGGAYRGNATLCSPNPCPVVLTPFVDPLPFPAVATPTSGVPGDTATYDMAIRQLTQQLHSDLPATTVWGFDDGTGAGYPGPTIEAATGNPVTVNWINDLRDSGGSLRTDHYLDVDMCPHGAADAPKTVIHLHGGHVPPGADGHPEASFLPGASATYVYPNNQSAGTIWYHDHALGITRLNVYMGLAGFYLVRDATEAALGLPEGAHDVPLAIQDRTFNPDGSLYYPSAWQEHFFGDKMLVNGKVWPYLAVDQGKYRFRLLNGCNSRTLTLALSNGDTFQVIGNDGGLLEAPVTVSELTIAPGERAEVVVDFEGIASGTNVDLVNSAAAPFPGSGGVLPEVMRFVVGSSAGHTAAIPSTLRTNTPLDEADAVESRDFLLEKTTDACGGNIWLINGLHWGDITEYPVLGTTEVWRFINPSGVMHPMHMHLVFFQVLDRQPFEMVSGTPSATGPAVPAAPEEAGWKDTVQVMPNEMVRVIARFDDYVGRYPYHCHILEHEDHEMMRQFETVTVCGDGILSAPIEQCDDGNLTDDDGCDADCTYSCTVDGDCADADVCNGTETCNSTTHACEAGTALSCDDSDACTSDGCNPSSGCVNTAISCDDSNACTTDSCDTSSGCVNTAISCDDSNACTTDSCDTSSGCVSTAIGCDDSNDCTADSCDSSSGCVNTAVADGTACGAGGSCESGVCAVASDAGPPDAGPPDAGTSDAGPDLDAGPATDAGPDLDAGSEDAGTDGAVADGAAPVDGALDGGDVAPRDDGGCGCRTLAPTHTDPRASWLLLVGTALLWRFRRRRRA